MHKKLKRLVYIIFVILIILVVIFTALFLIYDKNTRIIINDYSESVAKIKVNSILNNKVYDFLNENGLSYSELANITYGNDFDVKAIEIDSVKLNKIKSGIVSLVQKEIYNNGKFDIAIPVGTIIGNSFTINRGPAIPINMTMSSAVESNVISTFEGSGINQTLHRIVLRLKINTYIVMPWYRSNCILETDFVLCETVIVGKVPDAFTVVIESEGDNTGGLINDYSANNFN